MGTVIRAEISKSNDYYISKHRYYELKHFCLQYPEWKKAINEISYIKMHATSEKVQTSDISDITSELAEKLYYYQSKIKTIDDAIKTLEPYIQPFIFDAVTRGYSFEYFRTTRHIPCSKDIYYKAYREFFWALGNLRL